MKTEQIKTPSGIKNWNFVKNCIENHEQLLEALNDCILYSDDQKKIIEIAKEAIKKTRRI